MWLGRRRSNIQARLFRKLRKATEPRIERSRDDSAVMLTSLVQSGLSVQQGYYRGLHSQPEAQPRALPGRALLDRMQMIERDSVVAATQYQPCLFSATDVWCRCKMHLLSCPACLVMPTACNKTCLARGRSSNGWG